MAITHLLPCCFLLAVELAAGTHVTAATQPEGGKRAGLVVEWAEPSLDGAWPTGKWAGPQGKWAGFAFDGAGPVPEEGVGPTHDGGPRRRIPRSWVWNQFFVVEEYTGTEPIKVGRVHLEADQGDGSVRYELWGEGAGTEFTVDTSTGEVFVMRRLDREARDRYRLQARAKDAETGRALAAPSDFVVTVQDVNDNEPRFVGRQPYYGTVQEMASAGTLVMRLEATDADDPSYGNAAKLVYTLHEGGEYFSINASTGELRTLQGDLDREALPWLRAVVTARDMGGLQGGLVATATVSVTLGDVNDNPPRFTNASFEFHVREGAALGEELGRLGATDPDEGPNAEAAFRVLPSPSSLFFHVHTDPASNQGVVTLAQRLDYERQSSHALRVQVLSASRPQGVPVPWGPPHEAALLVVVGDEDEPPAFSAPRYRFHVSEAAKPATAVGSVTARDPDHARRPIRYRVEGAGVFEMNAVSGELSTRETLDRETTQLYNLSVWAYEEGMPSQDSRVWVEVVVTDVNDNAPQPKPTVAHTCDIVTEGQELALLGAVDRDEAQNARPFNFSCRDAHPNITLRDNGDGTASLLSRVSGHLAVSPLSLLVLVTDSGSPRLTGSALVLLHSCPCRGDGDGGGDGTGTGPHACPLPGSGGPAGGRAWSSRRAGLSPQAIAALVGSVLLLTALALLLLALRRRCAGPLRSDCTDVASDEGAIVRDNVVSYDDEGGGEEDTRAFDVSALAARSPRWPRPPRPPSPAAAPAPLARPSAAARRSPRAARPPGAGVSALVAERLRRADGDEAAPPYDSVQVYGDEGGGSVAGSLSSLGSARDGDDGDGGDGGDVRGGSRRRRDAAGRYDYLDEWGPRFEKLARLYSHGSDVEDDDDDDEDDDDDDGGGGGLNY
uniref:Cadherin-7-like n=1 Tax=Petromyzon marinus TaxID=7757 RepID=A0AAJ7XHF1_PETMA|nr:cadherin-7-like [Petromyzon marinus]